MKIKTPFLLVILSIITAIFCSFAFGKEINLYDQPAQHAKVIATIDSSAGIIPIFTPKEGTWMKVGDPRNGNVGWIKSSDLSSQPGDPSVMTFTQKIISNNPSTSQPMQNGQQPTLTNEQMQAMKRLQEQQRAAQQSVQQAVQHFMNDMNTLINQLPMLMPIIILPTEKPVTPQQQATTPPAQPAPAAPAPPGGQPTSQPVKQNVP